jgi:hypothetical protein
MTQGARAFWPALKYTGGRIRGLKTSVDDELSVRGMDRSGKCCRENEKRVCFHNGSDFSLVFQAAST